MSETTIAIMPSSEEVPGHAVASALASDSAPAGSVATTKPLGTLTLASTTSESSTPTKIPLYKVYALPVPIRTFPLPAFYPSNPISLIHLVYAWLKQSISPPPAEPFIIHEGLWDPRTRSVHINDSKSIRALWEQGFFGKGSLSRSEPNWLKRELARRGSLGGKTVSEERTESRREERRLAKWERAKAELEVVERQRLEEAEAHITPAEEKPLPNGQLGTEEVVVPSGLTSLERAPLLNGEPSSQEVTLANGPLDIQDQEVAFVNGELESQELTLANGLLDGPHSSYVPQVPSLLEAPTKPPQDPIMNGHVQGLKPPVGPAELLALPNSLPSVMRMVVTNGHSKALNSPGGPANITTLPNAVTHLSEDVLSAQSGSPELPVSAATDLILQAEVESVPLKTTTNVVPESPRPPVGPAELLALPNSPQDLARYPTPAVITASTLVTVSTPVTTPILVKPPIIDPAPTQDTRGSRPSKEPSPPVGSSELLALPNSFIKLTQKPIANGHLETPKPPVGPADLLAFPNSLADLVSVPPLVVGVASSDPAPFHLPFVDVPSPQRDRQTDSKAVSDHAQLNGVSNGLNDHLGKASALDQDRDVLVDAQTNGAKVNGVTETANGIISHVPSLPSSVPMAEVITPQKARPLKRQKSVRFSPKVESTTFQHFDPPSPNRFTGTPPKRSNALNGGAMDAVPPAVPSPPAASAPPAPVAPTPLAEHNEAVSSLDFPVTVGELPNREHFQLSPEEAFFLAFVLGVLTVLDPATGAPIPTDQLLSLFRAYSYFPPKEISSSLDALQPSDPFLVNYVVYHHFRSLGWVPRHGIKFGVDFILYQRGPVFDHSEFGIIIMPSFSDPLWKEHEHDAATKSWSWLMGVNRVLAHVLKGLVLVYVDVPSPPVFDKAIKAGGLAAALKQYTIREVMVRRFSANRNR